MSKTTTPARPATDKAGSPEAGPEVSMGDCCWYTDRSNHDELLSFESRGVAGFEYVLRCMEESLHNENPDIVHWFEFEDFVAQHNWQEPFLVCRAANILATWLRSASGKGSLALSGAQEERLDRIEEQADRIDAKLATLIERLAQKEAQR